MSVKVNETNTKLFLASPHADVCVVRETRRSYQRGSNVTFACTDCLTALSWGVTWHQWRNTLVTWAGGPTWWPWTPQWCSEPSWTWSARSGGIASCSDSEAWAAACCGSQRSWPRGERSAWSGPSVSSCCTRWTYAPPSLRCAFSTLSEGKMQCAASQKNTCEQHNQGGW